MFSNTPSVFGLVTIRAATSLGHELFERAEIDAAGLAGLDVLDGVAGDGGGGRVGAVGGIRNQDLLARVAALFEQRADQQDAGQFAVRAGGGLQRDCVHAGRSRRGPLPGVAITSMQPCGERFGLIGMRPGEAFGARHHFVDPRVVLHGAGTERVHAVIDGVVPGGEAREVADSSTSLTSGKPSISLAHVVRAERFAASTGGTSSSGSW